MRVRAAILMILLALCLGACGGGGGGGKAAGTGSTRLPSPTAELTEITVPCAKFAAAAKKITDAQTSLYTGSADGADAIDSLVAELNALKAGAPIAVRDALSRMAAAFADARELLANPTAENRSKIAATASKLSEDGQRITAYITSQCR